MEDKERKLGLSTIAIHTSHAKENFPHPVNTPVYLSSTFAFPTVDHGARIFSGEDPNGFTYGRVKNPTVIEVEKTLARLDSAEEALLFGSGMAAVSCVVNAYLKSGDHVIAHKTLYGGTHSTFTHKLKEKNVDVTMLDTANIDSVKDAIRSNTKMIYFESPTNPTMDVVPIKPIVELAKENEIITVIDSTFMSPILQRPLELGVDIVIHSVTKYLNGHSDVIAGSVATSSKLMEPIFMERLHQGGIISPMEAYLIGRGLKTLKVRIDAHEKNGKIVADYLKDHPMVEWIKYLGHPEHPDHEIAKTQQYGFSSMMAFGIKGDLETAKTFVNGLKFITRAVSLGGVESLISHPASTTHSDLAVSQEDRDKAGITDGLFRISVGIEDPEDLIYDFEQAFSKIKKSESIIAD